MSILKGRADPLVQRSPKAMTQAQHVTHPTTTPRSRKPALSSSEKNLFSSTKQNKSPLVSIHPITLVHPLVGAQAMLDIVVQKLITTTFK